MTDFNLLGLNWATVYYCFHTQCTNQSTE